MNGKKLLDAMQYIDEDLLADAEKMRAGAGQRHARRSGLRRFAAVAALAAASVLAVFTLRFVSGKGIPGMHDMGPSAPASSAPEAAMATAETAADTADAAPAEAFAAAEESVEEAMEMEEAVEAAPAAAAMAAAEKAETGAADTEEAEEAIEMKQAADALPAEEPAAAGGQQNAVAESAPAAVTEAETWAQAAPSGTEMSESEMRVLELHAFIDDALAGIPVKISGVALPGGTEGDILYDGTGFTVETGNTAIQYPYLVTCAYAGEDGEARTAYVLSDRPALSEADILQAAESRTGPEHICILLIE